MSIKIQCPNCGKRSSVHQRMVGRQMRCPSCEELIQIPTAEQIEEARRRKRAAAESAAAGVTLPHGGNQSGASAALASAEEIPWAAAIPVASQPAGQGSELEGRSDDSGFEPLPIGGRGKREETEMDMTPMVDVTFLLLIFFMVTASFALQKSIAMPRQQSDAPSSQPVEEPQDELDQVTVQIDEFGAFLVLAATWEREVAGKPSLVSALREAQPSSGGGARLVIECHEAAKLQSLVDAMDAGTISGYGELQVTQVDGFN
ncbi:biopolymer transporter ExbD [Candidatus Laterigemmans baculatus]|uniref:biopolymer transporter ExbD n=1 Tax=Candidatus Laterigemmans baculatus TaxID=2770505 RepID=UPI0013D91280|nr:biopolymer transporter ExbD [Candidatus Laterigemmans baculatus]